MEAGETWAYRARQQDPLAQVEIIKIGTKRPPRVHVRFVDEQFEGRLDWVSPARLKVRWEKADEWLAAERRWQAVVDASADVRGSVEHKAAEYVFDRPEAPKFIDDMDAYRYAVLTVTDPAGFVAKLGYPATDLVNEPGYVLDNGTVFAPWPALLTVAKQVAELDAEAVLAEVERDEARAEREATYGQWWRSRGEEHHFSAETCAEVDEKWKPVRNLVRQWCGAEARDRRDEVKALRQEVVRLGLLVERAITSLRQAGCKGVASRLERELGVPVEELRRARSPS